MQLNKGIGNQGENWPDYGRDYDTAIPCQYVVFERGENWPDYGRDYDKAAHSK